ncbi:MAG: DUF2239 family protein [Burkholderiales bacterium]|nr:MAG: DUF2239 family protein [Burkholderiales bacterium]
MASIPSTAAPPDVRHYTAFLGTSLVFAGAPADVALACANAIQGHIGHDALLVFDDATGQQVELDLRGTPAEAAARALTPADPSTTTTTSDTTAAPRGRGRPQLGVVSREVTLLPRHWDWLAAQPGGASVTLRKLVDEARRTSGGHGNVRAAQERAYRFLHAIAGNLPQFEEATRALFGGKADTFRSVIAAWPQDVAAHAQRLAADAFPTA